MTSQNRGTKREKRAMLAVAVQEDAEGHEAEDAEEAALGVEVEGEADSKSRWAPLTRKSSFTEMWNALSIRTAMGGEAGKWLAKGG